MKHIKSLLFLLTLTGTLQAQTLQRPKLVIGIVVDQMKYDYVYRYWDKMGNGGFKRLIREGYSCNNTKYNYSPTITGPGHASIYTGATPSIHGIICNDWHDRNTGKNIYCVGDTTVDCVGCDNNTGRMSPRNLLANTIGDELKLATNFKGKVIGIALKDRGAILPAGHSADAAYWFDNITGNWVSSSYYRPQLPAWLNRFNDLKYADQYKNQTWNTLLPIASYTESTADNTPYEKPFKGEGEPVFPHDFGKLNAKDYENIRRSPFGNTLTKDIAKAAITGEELGQDATTDLLCISFSSTDYIGHQFGINAIETEDCYLRLDRDIEDLLNFIDLRLGKKNVLLFLTADHGAMQNPQYLSDHKFNAGYYSERGMLTGSRTFFQAKYGDSLLLESLNDQSFYLDKSRIAKMGLNKLTLSEELAAYLMTLPSISNAYTASALRTGCYTSGPTLLLQSAYNAVRSGDVFYILEPNYFESEYSTGTTHGSPYNYDTHVPLYFYGYTIAPGIGNDPVSITDIAPTIASLLFIEFPNGSSGNPIKINASKK